MLKDGQDTQHGLRAIGRRRVTEKLDAAGWGLFFIWVGICFLLDVGWGVGLIGVGLITLAGQAGRQFWGLSIEWCWVIIGLFFLLGGVWELAKIEVSLVSIALVVVGVVLLLSALGGGFKFGGSVCGGRSEWW